jgi:hypothetical protein
VVKKSFPDSVAAFLQNKSVLFDPIVFATFNAAGIV